ncbi:MAG: radical SAM/SPASM domain protein, ACGX system [Muribaculaceae bacterium]|nr:radical SAM/SPASM domain protein, ACGX system [Muribaculaceae bacterium]
MDYFAFQWHITDSCDQRCEHCYIFSEGHPHLIEMPVKDAKVVIEQCLDMCRHMNRLPYFYITGGDPILHQDFNRIMSMLKMHDIPFTILGNPFHITDELCRQLKSYGCEKYQLSIDGMRETHDSIRKPGSFDTTVEKIDVLKRNGIRVAVMTTVSGTNLSEIPDIIDLVVEKGVNVFAFGRYCPTSSEKSTHISPGEYRNFLDLIWHKFEQHKDSGTIFNLKDHLWTLYLYEKGLFKIPADSEPDVIYDGCHCGDCHFTIQPNGNVMACRRFESVVGNLFKKPLYNIWTGTEMNYYRQFEKFEKCAKCELLRFCRGCPAVAYGYHRSFYSPDPQCWKEI